MVEGQLARLLHELRSLDRKTFLSSRERRRRDTLSRQIPLARQELERQQERQSLRQRINDRIRQERQLRRRSAKAKPDKSQRPTKVLKARKCYRCVMCSRIMRRKKLFCGKRCRRAASRLPSPLKIYKKCERIRAKWSEDEEARRRRLGGGKLRAAAAVIEDLRNRQAKGQLPVSHDLTFHGSHTYRADNDYWNQTGPGPTV